MKKSSLLIKLLQEYLGRIAETMVWRAFRFYDVLCVVGPLRTPAGHEKAREFLNQKICRFMKIANLPEVLRVSSAHALCISKIQNGRSAHASEVVGGVRVKTRVCFSKYKHVTSVYNLKLTIFVLRNDGES